MLLPNLKWQPRSIHIEIIKILVLRSPWGRLSNSRCYLNGLIPKSVFAMLWTIAGLYVLWNSMESMRAAKPSWQHQINDLIKKPVWINRFLFSSYKLIFIPGLLGKISDRNQKKMKVWISMDERDAANDRTRLAFNLPDRFLRNFEASVDRTSKDRNRCHIKVLTWKGPKTILLLSPASVMH